MKSMSLDHNSLFSTAPTSHLQHCLSATAGKEHTGIDTLLITAIGVAIVVLYLAMFTGLYRWSHYDPLLPPDSVTVASITAIASHPMVVAAFAGSM